MRDVWVNLICSFPGGYDLAAWMSFPLHFPLCSSTASSCSCDSNRTTFLKKPLPLSSLLCVRPSSSHPPASLASPHTSYRSTHSQQACLENIESVMVWTQNLPIGSWISTLAPHLLALSGEAVVALDSEACLREIGRQVYCPSDVSCPISATCSIELRWGEEACEQAPATTELFAPMPALPWWTGSTQSVGRKHSFFQ